MGPVIYTKSNLNRGFTQSLGFLRKRVDFFDNYECSGRIFRLDSFRTWFCERTAKLCQNNRPIECTY